MSTESTRTADVYLDRSYRWRAPGERTAVTFEASPRGGTTTIPAAMALALAKQGLINYTPPGADEPILANEPEPQSQPATLGIETEQAYNDEALDDLILPLDFPDRDVYATARIYTVGEILKAGDLTKVHGIGPAKAKRALAEARTLALGDKNERDHARYEAENTPEEREEARREFARKVEPMADDDTATGPGDTDGIDSN